MAIVPGTLSDFRHRHPAGDECLLVIEVADSSLARDKFKAAAYASGRVPEYWIVDLTGRQIIRHFEPLPDGYTRIETADAAEIVLPGGTFRVSAAELFND